MNPLVGVGAGERLRPPLVSRALHSISHPGHRRPDTGA